MTTTIPAGWKLVEALRESLLWTASSLAAVGKEQDLITLEGRKRTIGEILDEANAALDAPSLDCVAPGVSTVEDAQDMRSATHGMPLGERIAHVGGRTNAQGYIEFGSPMAVNALIQHVLRDIDCTRQEDDGAYQARYRLPGGQWSSWGHVVCGVKGHEQELRYLPGERCPAPAAGDALPSKPGVYAWSAGTSNALVLVDRRPSAHSPAGVLNGHVIESTRFYDGCAVESWGRDGRWTLLHDFAAAIAAQRKGDA